MRRTPPERTGAQVGPALSRPAWLLLRLGWAGRGRAWGVLTVWLLVERLHLSLRRLRPIRPGGMYLHRVTRYRGPEVRLRSGLRVRPGDPVVELHLDNRALRALAPQQRSAWALLRRTREDLRALAGLAAEGSLGGARAARGVTLLGSGAPRAGFESHPLPLTRSARLERFFMVGLVALYDPGGWRAARTYASRWPAEVWLDLAEPK